MTACYEQHFDAVFQAVGTVLGGADRETVVHEVFFRLLSDEALRRNFDDAGSFAAWLRVVAKNHAIDHVRRRRREILLPNMRQTAEGAEEPENGFENQAHLHLTLERFQREVLPPKWERVFVARFVEHQDQPTAARALGMGRTTLAYQEHRIRRLLRSFVLKGERG